MECWNEALRPNDDRICTLHQLAAFQRHHELRIPKGFQTRCYIGTQQEANEFAKEALSETNTRKFSDIIDHKTPTPPEHQFFCLPFPEKDDPIYKDRLQGFVADPSSQHVVVFSSINLLRQLTVAKRVYGDKVLACIDSSHCKYLCSLIVE